MIYLDLEKLGTGKISGTQVIDGFKIVPPKNTAFPYLTVAKNSSIGYYITTKSDETGSNIIKVDKPKNGGVLTAEGSGFRIAATSLKLTKGCKVYNIRYVEAGENGLTEEEKANIEKAERVLATIEASGISGFNVAEYKVTYHLDDPSDAEKFVRIAEEDAAKINTHFSDDYSMIILNEGYELKDGYVTKIVSRKILTQDETLLEDTVNYKKTLTEDEIKAISENAKTNIHENTIKSYELLKLLSDDEKIKKEYDSYIKEESEKSEIYVTNALITAANDKLESGNVEVIYDPAYAKSIEYFTNKANEALANGDYTSYFAYMAKLGQIKSVAEVTPESTNFEDKPKKTIQVPTDFESFKFTVPAKTNVTVRIEFDMPLDTWGMSMKCECDNGWGKFNINPWVHNKDGYDGLCGAYDNEYGFPVMKFYANEEWKCELSRYDGKTFQVKSIVALDGDIDYDIASLTTTKRVDA